MRKIENDLSLKNMAILKPWKQIVLFAIGLAGLTLLGFTYQLLLEAFSRLIIQDDYDYYTFISSNNYDMAINGSVYLTIFIVMLILVSSDFDEFLKSFKSWKPYIAGLVGFGAIMMFNITYNIILSATGLVVSDNANEESLNSIVTSFPFLSLFIFGIVGPIVEEITYRVGLFSFLRRISRVLAYIVTIIVFTLIHFNFSGENLINELLNIPFYAFAAITFTLIYEKFGFAGSMCAHVTNNLFSVGLTILGMFQ